ncbi:PREDICTED: uncharacterized protein LOC105563359 [Vollenhovia emeryi]|uniref:uncharacterized protein LOC105563359 n=1 Tax=Vollenhovia emeryi TaxID=411798 RepID=UPI0005F41C88|nr:PREDICTED: uncharacterized protein LOC105563359 [Vollenhovia emeryi]XP_011870279.1 PREDICTED: uncharacterized protein LOC105563359 [Vollenhovia emeryi]XP_011870280.1 PREDICTED: uncharacterized protein LOC105563359 [Vollenhovia emeryi]XP_011870281.1 PREDICTED: uncharacterized protein LOC105563359 [Vollenhovia emeryi]XP_011870282.1 PREDICTED: uncharacterized protein LOC105563359 [Vollenhovia emeryi]XP_011870283.1 PREDICTED: uncharacterized protein LOC105563359 [Vollenhovia emeryi]
MLTRMNLVRFFGCVLVVAVIEMTITCAELDSTARMTRSELIDSDIKLKNFADSVKNYYYTFGKARYGKRSDAVPMMELNAIWETLKMIQDAQRQNKQQREENIRQNKEQILLRDFPSSDEYTSYTIRFPPDVIGKYYNDVQ